MIEQIRPAMLPEWLAKVSSHGSPLVLDVREPHELRTASIKPASFELQTIPMSILGSRLHELDRHRPVACLCHHGGRSMQVANFLLHHGFAHVANIAGGINAWSQEVDPTIPRY